MMKYITLIFFIFLLSCGTLNNSSGKMDYDAVTVDQFIEKPFGYPETIGHFITNNGNKYRIQKLIVTNKHHPDLKDTIYRFFNRKSTILFYKTYSDKEFLLSGSVKDKKMIMVNGIRVGFTREEFIDSFKDLESIRQKDTVTFQNEGIQYRFIFKKEKLKEITIDSYFD